VLAIGSRCAAGELQSAFAIHDGDRVVFYGDSITQDGGYACFVEEYCRTRFPRLDVRFFNAGVGGDTVQGGSAGDIGLRLDRDVIRHKPTIVTIMLGMNDGRYRKLEPATLASFTDGYRMIVAKLRQALPRARIYLIRSSPFDDVARPPNFEPGYMNVLRRMGEAVEAIAREQQATVVDFGGAVASGLELAVRNDPERAHHLLPDRVHPSPAGHVLMGATLLRALGATALVSRVEIDAKDGKVAQAENASLSDLKLSAGLVTWNELDQSSPLPLNFQDANVELAQIAGANLESLDSEVLVVRGLPRGRYEVQVDDKVIGSFPSSDLARGVNLALIDTPMRWKAYQVLWASEEGRNVQLLERSLRHGAAVDQGALAAADFLLAKDESDQASRSKGAIPVERHYRVQIIP
jgi:lysophospholipase L1-like esterase